MKIGFIGAGNMGGAILRGALNAGAIKSEDTYVFGVHQDKLKQTAAELGIHPLTDISTLVQTCDIFFLGVKPQIFGEVMPKVADGLKALNKSSSQGRLIVSMAAGITIAQIEGWVGPGHKIVRIMPNTPASVGMAMTSVSRNPLVTDAEMSTLMEIFSGIGLAEEVPEDLIHTVIGVSGSSPAYTFMYIGALIDEAVREGMTPEAARHFAAQAVMGAAKMVMETDIDPEILCKNVCSPGGTTIEAVELFRREGLQDMIARGFKACTDRSKELSK